MFGFTIDVPPDTLCSAGCRDKLDPVHTLELVYTSLLVLVALLITWFAFYVVYRLVHEEK